TSCTIVTRPRTSVGSSSSGIGCSEPTPPPSVDGHGTCRRPRELRAGVRRNLLRDDACALGRPLVLASAVEPAPDLSPRRASHALSGLPPHTVHAVPRRFGPCLEHPRAAPLAPDRGHAGLGPRRGLAPRGRDRRDRGSRRPLQRCPHPVSSSGAGARTAPVVSHGPPPARAPSRR